MSVCQQRDISALCLPCPDDHRCGRERTIGKGVLYTASGIMGSPLLPPLFQMLEVTCFCEVPPRVTNTSYRTGHNMIHVEVACRCTKDTIERKDQATQCRSDKSTSWSSPIYRQHDISDSPLLSS
ncbi:hypothetical protein ATANTOWER_022563 [Ataeniobius toweri]|uniref:Uncharacterized protein n=1 Tax=Ataeniobius toweri TaxID=208326 RepID=A0ABU7BY36_9TELE|nr:hypothetical protein [Ataeniobius toweri]